MYDMDFLSPFLETLHISFFVMVVLMLMEYWELFRMRVRTLKGKGTAKAGETSSGKQRAVFGQLLFAAALGLVPGCVGGFMVVSLYAHKVLGFGAVVAASFTALGDDAFRMFSSEPGFTLALEAALFVLAVPVGWLSSRMFRNAAWAEGMACKVEWHGDAAACPSPEKAAVSGKRGGRLFPAGFFRRRLQEWSLSKVLLSALIALYGFSLLGGLHFHEHGPGVQAVHWDFEHALFFFLSLSALVLVVFSDEHFLQEHLWRHLLRKHFPSIFLWTLGTLYIIGALEATIDLQAWISADSGRLVLLFVLAVIVGWIPQSGPHFLFAQLYFSGSLPLGVFLANAVVQDGHTSLMLVAQSRKAYVALKACKSLLVLAAGAAAYLFL